jgi:transposase-like protein
VSARRLNDTEKQTIVKLYRESGETAMSLAEQFGVSNTTISRILKAGIDSDEYDRLIQQKRRGGDAPTLEIAIPLLEEPQQEIAPVVSKAMPVRSSKEVLTPDPQPKANPADEMTPSGRRIRRRTTAEPQSLEVSIAPPTPMVERSLAFPVQTRLPLMDPEVLEEMPPAFEASNKPVRKVIQVGVAKRPEPEILDDDEEDLLPPVTEEMAAILEEDFGEDEEDEDEDDDQEDDDEQEEDSLGVPPPSLHVQQFMQVLPLEQASMPRVCYLVVDRSAELVLRPLKDFGDMGQVPPGRDQVLTLPIFDNPRVAKRFANARTERVIKIPDSQVFHKTASKLRSKGITYLYIDGQLYSL